MRAEWFARRVVGAIHQSMLFLALALVVAPLAWLALRHADPTVRRAAVGCAIACGLVAVALRAGPVPTGLLLAALMFWLLSRGSGGDWRDDDDRDPPAGPGPGPGGHAKPRPEVLDPEALDRARAEWERQRVV